MKCTYIVFSCLFSFAVYSQQNLDTIYGNPKSVREKVEFLNEKKQNYVFMSGDGDYGHALIFTPENIRETFKCNWFDSKGCFYINYRKNLLENGLPKNEIWYNKDESFEREYKYIYDEKNNLVEEMEVYFDNEFTQNKYHYNKQDSLIAHNRYFSDEPNEFIHWYYERNSRNYMTEIKRYDNEGKDDILFLNFDRLGNLKRVTKKRAFNWINAKSGIKVKKDSIGKEMLIREYSYDERNNKILDIKYDEAKKFINKKIYKYDERNNLIYEGYARDTVYAYRKYNYNIDNLKIRSEYSVVNKPNTRNIVNYFYDKQHYITKVVYTTFDNYSGDKKEYDIRYTYKFDKEGNWTKIIKIVNDEPLYVWSRKIKYY